MGFENQAEIVTQPQSPRLKSCILGYAVYSQKLILGVNMFSHVMVGANDLEASRKFYDAVLVPWALRRVSLTETFATSIARLLVCFRLPCRLITKRRLQQTAVRSDLQRNRQTRLTRFTLLPLRMAE